MVLLLYLWENVRKWSSFEHFESPSTSPSPDLEKQEARLATEEEEDEEEEEELSITVQGSGNVELNSTNPLLLPRESFIFTPVTGEESEVNGVDGITPSISHQVQKELSACNPNPSQGYQQMGGLRRLDTGAIRTHFYPEGGWGWIVCACAFLAHVTTSGAQLSAGALHIVLANKFQDSTAHHWLGPLSWSISSVCSPLVVNLCRRKNVRLLSLLGGILFPLSLLLTSFANELHQIFFSFGLIGGIGSCMVRESSGVVLGEFFRKRRQFVEQVVMAGTGVGVTLFSLLYLSFTRHLEWGLGFRVGAAFATICVLLPAFYRTAAKYQPRDRTGKHHQRVESPKSPSTSMAVPIGGDIFRSLKLFCIPALKPLLWSSAISSFGLYAPIFLMSDFGRKEGLSGGSLLLLQTHLGLGLSLGVILGAILTLKKFKFCQLSPRVLCIITACLTGVSMIAISSVKGYYGYSLSAWIYGVALGAHLYTLKVLTMELTRTRHWSRIWSCIESLMSPGIVLGSGLTSYIGKPGFYACATAVFIGAGLVGFQLIDMAKCSSPQLSSSLDNDSPIPPAPPPITLGKYGHAPPTTPLLGVGVSGTEPSAAGMYPLRRSISLQQPIYPCCQEAGELGVGIPFGGLGYGLGPSGYSPYCRECVLSGSPVPPWGMYYQPTPTGTMIRSYSLPQTAVAMSGSHPNLKSRGTQTNPNSPVKVSRGVNGDVHYPGSYERLPTFSLPATFIPQDRVISDRDLKVTTTKAQTSSLLRQSTSTPSHPPQLRGVAPYKSTVMFASNPQLFPASSSATSTTDRSSIITPNYNNHNHHHHHHRRDQKRQDNNDDNNSSPSRSPQRYSYYPEREERRANFIKSHQQESKAKVKTNGQQEKPYHYPPPSYIQASVETHKKPAEIIPSFKPQPAFTRHYFDSSKIQKGKPGGGPRTSLFPFNINEPPFKTSTTTTTAITTSTVTNNLNTTTKGPNNLPRSQNAQRSQKQSLPISASAVKAKLQQYQKQKDREINWREIQRQSTSLSSNPFDNDPDPPYYPASQSQTQAYQPPPPIPPRASKVSGHEFDVDPPKFNSLGRQSRNGQDSSVSSQINYSILGLGLGVGQGQFGQGYPSGYSTIGSIGISPYSSLHKSSLPHSHPHHRQRQQGSNNDDSNGNVPCPYCDPRGGPVPPLSLSVPTLQESDPHYMCHYGYGQHQPQEEPHLKRRNTWHHQKDQPVEAITTSV